jgi:carboxypeptidase Taq
MTAREAYDLLLAFQRDTAYLASMGALLHWDQRTQTPPAGQAHRAQQLAALAKQLHARQTDPRIGDCLAAVEGSQAGAEGGVTSDPESAEAANVREWRRAYNRTVRIPEALAVELARTASEGQTAWELARPLNDWNGFKPYLKRIVELKREEADCLGFQHEPYDALLDDFEPGETAADLKPVFDALLPRTVALLDRIRDKVADPARPARPTRKDMPALCGPVPPSRQEAFIRQVVNGIGYSFDQGRMDPTAHPFCIRIGPGDTRITTRFDEHDFCPALFSSIHETGHALYCLGLPSERFGEPAGTEVSLGIHESQSRLWENLVGRSTGFWRHFYPKAQAAFPSLEGVALDDFLFAVNQSRPGLIRVDADELTYNLHVMLRFELELALVRKDLDVDDLPEAWNERMRKYLGIVPPDCASGVMQDVHWSAGLIGYFPTYTLGNIYAAQLYATACKDLGGREAMEESFARGEFRPLLDWLRTNIHARGSILKPRELIKRVTGEDVNPLHLTDYLERKYGRLYGL